MFRIFQKLRRQIRPSSRIMDAEGNKALSPERVDLCKDVSGLSSLFSARQHINHNLEHSPSGTFWIHEDYSEATAKEIASEYRKAGWNVLRGKEIMVFKRKDEPLTEHDKDIINGVNQS